MQESNSVRDVLDHNYHSRLANLYPCVDNVSQLPKKWSSETKAPMLGLAENSLRCYFRGSYGNNEDADKVAASIQADQPIPSSCLLYYFEIEIIAKGFGGCQVIGLTSSAVHVLKLPGWSLDSYGYHGDDGNKFCGTSHGRGHAYGPTFSVGDIVGCGYNLIERTCFFTKNGVNLGIAFRDIPPSTILYPSVGLKTSGEEIKANFGQSKFAYNIEQDLRALRKNMTLLISNHPISDFSDWQTTIHKLIQSWLVYNSYPKTAEVFSQSTQIDLKENIHQMHQRYKIQQLILNGKVSEAIKLTNATFPELLRKNPNLLFVLKCRQFVEMIAGCETELDLDLKSTSPYESGDDVWLAKLLAFGQDLSEFEANLRRQFGYCEQNEKLLIDTLSLIAFVDAQNSPLSCQFDIAERERLSQMLNSSIQVSELGMSHRTPFEEVVGHLNKIVRLNNSQGKWLIDKLQY